MIDTHQAAPPESSQAQPPRWSQRVRESLRLLRVRLRFVSTLLLMAIVIGQWDWLVTHYQHWTSRFIGGTRQQAVSPDTEYFCPMCPGVLSGWPDTCPVCNMPLVRRRKGEAVMLPTGVIARMQLSPQRIQLAGLQTATVEYRALEQRIELLGHVEAPTSADAANASPPVARPKTSDARTANLPGIIAAVSPAQKPLVARVRSWEIVDPHSSERHVLPATVEKLAETADANGLFALRVRLSDKVAADRADFLEATTTSVRLLGTLAIADLAPFCAQPHGIPDWQPSESHFAYLCIDHRDEAHVRAGKCPHDGLTLEAYPLAENQRVRWTCPHHAEVRAERADAHCENCPDHKLVGRIVTFAPAGQVLAIPETALIDTGAETIVYVESAPGMYDGIRVQVGARCGTEVPVIAGLASGQRVVTRGAFLVDAETRLNPSIAATYFGAAGSSSSSASSPSPSSTPPVLPAAPVTATPAGKKPAAPQEVRKLLAKFDMPVADRALAERQATCPITGMALGSMGKPPKKTVGGETVFICCEGCAAALMKTSAATKANRESGVSPRGKAVPSADATRRNDGP